MDHDDSAMFDVIRNGHARPVDNKVMPLLAERHAMTKVMPEVNNFDEIHQRWVSEEEGFFSNAAARADFRRQIINFLSTDDYKGLMVDFENIHSTALDGYRN